MPHIKGFIKDNDGDSIRIEYFGYKETFVTMSENDKFVMNAYDKEKLSQLINLLQEVHEAMS